MRGTDSIELSRPPGRWWRQAGRNVWRLGWLKAAGSTLYMATFFHFYFLLLRNPAYPVTDLPPTSFDRWLPFQAWAFWPYVSQWVYVCLPAALQPDLKTLLRHGLAAGGLCIIGIGFYYYLPTSFTLAGGNWPADHPGAFLAQADQARNVFPSMHVAFACFSAVWVRSALRSIGAPGWLQALNLAWAMTIIYSTLAIKQHILWDVAAGVVLGLLWGWGTCRWARHQRDRDAPAKDPAT